MCVRLHAVGVVCLLFLAGCAISNTVPVAFDDMTTRGIRVYDIKPLLFVYDNSSIIQFVPNYNRAYAVRFGAFLAKNNVNLKVDNGAITEFDSFLDSTDFINFLTTILPKLIPPAKGSSQPAPVNDHLVGIYDFEFDESGSLIGLRSLYHDKPLPPPKV
jgi:hypothetical protein